MELQSDISYRLNQEKVSQTFKVLFDEKKGNTLLVEQNLTLQM